MILSAFLFALIFLSIYQQRSIKLSAKDFVAVTKYRNTEV